MAQLKIFVLVIVLAIASTSWASDSHPIDQFLDECLEKHENMTTAGMTSCTYQAMDKWNNEVNTLYQQLMKNLDQKSKSELEKSQSAWLAFQELERKSIASIYEPVQGTMYVPIRAMSILLISKHRAESLKRYADAIRM